MNTAIASNDELLSAECAPVIASPLIERGAPAHAISLSQLTTLILWLGCAGVGLFGFVLPYARPQAPAKPAAPPVEVLNIQLSAVPELQPSVASGAQPTTAAMSLPPAPQPVAVAEPSAAIAFAIPVENISRITDVRNASYVQTPVNHAVVPTVQQLTFGQGEGRQPAPDYPARAQREGQQGTVVIRLTVGENGKVLAAEAVAPSPWSLLNESALRVVKSRWVFASGQMRVYEIPIRFVL